jgi:putative ABC transport system ATP-binding protein
VRSFGIMIVLNHIFRSFGEKDNVQAVLTDVSLSIQKGEMCAVMGPSGSGKSTLLNIIGLLDQQYEGDYLLDGIDIAVQSEKELAALRSRKIGFVFQSFQLLRDLTVLENVEIGIVIANLTRKGAERVVRKERKERAEELLIALGLEQEMKKKAWMLSGGQMQRTAIARALVNDPDLILADEPTGALDQKNGEEVMRILYDLNSAGKTVLVVTHDEQVASYCGRRILLLDGKV